MFSSLARRSLNHVFMLFLIFACASAARVRRAGSHRDQVSHNKASLEAAAGPQLLHNVTGNATLWQNQTGALVPGLGFLWSGWNLLRTAKGHYDEVKKVYQDFFEGKIFYDVESVGHKLLMAKNWPDMANELVESHSEAVDLLVHALNKIPKKKSFWDFSGSSNDQAAADQAMSHDEWALTKQVGALIHHADQRCSKQLHFQWTRFAAEWMLKQTDEEGSLWADLPPAATDILNKFTPNVSDTELKSAIVSIHAASQSYHASLDEFRKKGICKPLQKKVTSYIEILGSEIKEWEDSTGYSWHEQLRWEKIQRLSEMDGLIEGTTMLDYTPVPEVSEECRNVQDTKNYSAGASLEPEVRMRMAEITLMVQDLATDCSHLKVSTWLQSSRAKKVAKCSPDLDLLMTWAGNEINAQAEREMKRNLGGYSKRDPLLELLFPIAEKFRRKITWDGNQMPPLVTQAMSYFKNYLSPLLNMAIKKVMKDAPAIIDAVKGFKNATKDAAHFATFASIATGAATANPLTAIAWVRSVNHLASRFVDNIDVRSDCLELAKFFDETQE